MVCAPRPALLADGVVNRTRPARRALPGLVPAALAAALCCALVAAPAQAAEQDPGGERARAAKHHDDGVAASRAGQHAEAAGHFDAAFEMDPHPTLLWNAARAWARAGRSAEARVRYLRYSVLEGVGAALREEALMRHEDLARAERAGRLVGVALGAEVAGAVSAGKWEARAPTEASPLEPAGWTLVGVGGAAAVSGVVLLVLAEDLNADLGQLSGATHDGALDQFNRLEARVDQHRALGATFLAVGGAALAVGVTLVLLAPEPGASSGDALSWGIVPSRDGGLVTASGRF